MKRSYASQNVNENLETLLLVYSRLWKDDTFMRSSQGEPRKENYNSCMLLGDKLYTKCY